MEAVEAKAKSFKARMTVQFLLLSLLCTLCFRLNDRQIHISASLSFYAQVRLAVAGAFHTSFMEPAVSRLEAALAATEIRTPRIPVISNVDAQPHADPDTIKKILARQARFSDLFVSPKFKQQDY